MSLVHLAFTDLTEAHIEQIRQSIEAAPKAVRPDVEDILRMIATEAARAFAFGNGLIVVSTPGDKRLRIDAFTGKIMSRRQVAEALRQLAADWECDTIETYVFDPRLASAITAIGGRVEAWSMTLAVE